MPTIKDVAKKANVSVATVSRVLNNKGYVNKDTRALVEQAIKELNYVPNEIARSLFRKSSKVIGIILYDLKNEFFNEMISQIESLIFDRGYQTMICTTGENPQREAHYFQALATNKVAGLIICSDITSLGINLLPNIPTVSLERIIKDSIPSIDCDNVMGGFLAGEKLIGLGCCNILQFTGPLNLSSSSERSNGFLSALSDFPQIKVHSYELDFNTFTTEEILDHLKNHPDVDGVFAASDKIAVNVMKCLNLLKRQTPEDVKIIGFDDVSIAQLSSPSLSTIAQPVAQMSKAAIDTLFELIHDEQVADLHQIIPVQLVERESTQQ